MRRYNRCSKRRYLRFLILIFALTLLAGAAFAFEQGKLEVRANVFIRPQPHYLMPLRPVQEEDEQEDEYEIQEDKSDCEGCVDGECNVKDEECYAGDYEKTEPDLESEPEPDLGLGDEPEPEAEPDFGSEIVPEPESDLELDVESESEPDLGPEIEPELDFDSEVEPEPEPEHEFEPESGLEPEAVFVDDE